MTWGQRILEGLKTLAWLAPLTLVIWLYAEREQTAFPNAVPIPITVPPDSSTRVYRIVEPENHTLLVDLSGPQAGIDQLTAKLRGTAQGGSGAVEISVIEPPGHHTPTLTALPQLNANRFFKRYGVTARNCTPTTIRIEVDDLVEKELKIQPPPGLDLATEPTFSPATVKVTAPSRFFERATLEHHLYLTADLADRVAKLAADPEHRPADPRGLETLPAVRVAWPYGEDGQEHVSFSTPTVTATVVFRAREASYTIPSLGVQPTALVSLLNDYIIECPERVTGVKVVGPPEAIELLQRGQYRDLKALLEIDVNDEAQPDTQLQRPLKFILPNGVRIKDNEPYSVPFRLKKRERGS